MTAMSQQKSDGDDAEASYACTIPSTLLAVLACPACGHELECASAKVTCSSCGGAFPVANGVPIFIDADDYLAVEALQHSRPLDVSVVLWALDDAPHLDELVAGLRETLAALAPTYEIILADGGSSDETVTRAHELGLDAVIEGLPEYGDALREAFRLTRGRYIVTMAADLYHDPGFVKNLYEKRDVAELVVASRYVPGGSADTPFMRKHMSRAMNSMLGSVLSLPHKDMTSDFRLYHSKIVDTLPVDATGYDFLAELLIKVHMLGWRILELPYGYTSPRQRISSRRSVKLAMSYMGTLVRLWRLRNSVFSADYDDRAFNSIIPLQRYWQRERHRTITDFLSRSDQSGLVLDIGCGSSRIIQSIPNAVGLDIELKKLRFIQGRLGNPPLVQASMMQLPFRDASFDKVVCSEVIEHVEKDPVIYSEISRVLKPGGALIIGTPDYGTWTWPVIEWFYGKILPNAYVDEHISHYTEAELTDTLRVSGFRVDACEKILSSEMNMLATKEGNGNRP